MKKINGYSFFVAVQPQASIARPYPHATDAVSAKVSTVPLGTLPKSWILVRSATLMVLPLAFPCKQQRRVS